MLDSLAKIERTVARLEKWMPPKAAKVPRRKLIDQAIAQLPPWASPLLEPRRYKALYGGRGGGKSIAIADSLLLEALRRPIRVLCAREYQNSINDSVLYLLNMRIQALGMGHLFTVLKDTIKTKDGRSEFIFKGIRYNVSSIQSIAGITHCWVEEAQTISANSWRVLTPSIRLDGSEIWLSFNPRKEDDPVYREFVLAPPDENTWVRKVNWNENPYFTEALELERRRSLQLDAALYKHVWEGELLQRTDDQIFANKWAIAEFEPAAGWEGPFYGCDFGFSTSPTVLVKLWIHNNRLYIERESAAFHLELDDTGIRWMEDVPGCESAIVRADSARPTSINYLRSHGLPGIVGAKKGANSIAEGVRYIRSFQQVIIHPRCGRTSEEFRLYRYKVDEFSGKVTDIIIDAYNDAIDSIRYALEPKMRASRRQNPPPGGSIRNWG